VIHVSRPPQIASSKLTTRTHAPQAKGTVDTAVTVEPPLALTRTFARRAAGNWADLPMKHDIDALVDAWQATLAKASEKSVPRHERAIVQAVVVANAREARSHLIQRVPGGDKLIRRVDTFVSEAEKDDHLGRLFSATDEQMRKAVKSVVVSAATLSWPPGLVAIAGILLNTAGVFHDVGKAVGGVIAVLLTAVTALLVRNPGAAARGAQIIAPAAIRGATNASTWVSSSYLAALKTVDAIGSTAERIVADSMQGSSTAFFGSPIAPGRSIIATTRNTAKYILRGTAGLVIIALLIVVSGIWDGLASQPHQCRVKNIVTGKCLDLGS
jgi:hypothetical protein